MSDRVPIGTIPGSASGLVGFDVILGTFGVAAEITRLWLTRSGHGPGDVVSGSIRNAPAGGGAGFNFAFAAGADTCTATGSLTVTASESAYLRIAASDAFSQDLRGWFELTEAGTTAGVFALTNLFRVKQWRGIEGSSFDAVISTAILGTSARMQSYMRRRILLEDITEELHDGPCADTLILRSFPILDPLGVVVRESDAVVPSSEYVVVAPSGLLVRTSGGFSGGWSRGRLNVSVDYSAGFSFIPEDLVFAATRQAAYVALESPAGNLGRLGNRGTVLAEGGTAEYITKPWLDGVLDVLDAYRDRRMI